LTKLSFSHRPPFSEQYHHPAAPQARKLAKSPLHTPTTPRPAFVKVLYPVRLPLHLPTTASTASAQAPPQEAVPPQLSYLPLPHCEPFPNQRLLMPALNKMFQWSSIALRGKSLLGVWQVRGHNRASWTICQSWLQIAILISVSWVAKITGMSHWNPAMICEVCLLHTTHHRRPRSLHSKLSFACQAIAKGVAPPPQAPPQTACFLTAQSLPWTLGALRGWQIYVSKKTVKNMLMFHSCF
jgi:hypothetical protein